MNQLTAVMERCRLLFFLFFVCGPVSLFAQLKADFVPDKTGGCAPFTVSFSNTTVGASSNAVFRWDLGNSNSSSIKSPGAIYTEEKTYTVTLTVTDGTQTSVKTANITVYKKPTADFSVAAAKVCIPAPATFNSSSTAGDGNIASYFWDFGDGMAQQGFGNSINHNYNYEQKPTVSLTVTNSFGCYNSITKPAALEVLGRITPIFTVDKNLLCNLEEPIKLTNNSTGPGTLFYKWDFGDGITSTEKNPTHNFSQKNVFPVRLTVSNTDGCSVTSSPVSVNAAHFNTNFSNSLLCREATFSGSSYLYPNSSLWLFGDAASSTSSNTIKHIYNTPGTYKVTLINTYGNCKDTVSKTIQVADNVNYNSDIIAPSSVCKDGNVSFKSTSSVTPGSSYWEFGDGNLGYWRDVNHIYRTPGTYTVKLTNTFGTCKETVTKQIVVNELPDVNGFVIDYGGICGSPVTVKFKDTTASAVSWDWQLNSYPYGTFSTQQTASHSFTNDGTYRVSLTVKNAAGCSQSTFKTLSIFKPNVVINYVSSSSPQGSYDCDSLTIKFSTQSNMPLTGYLWNFGDGVTSTEVSPQHTFKTVGIFSVSLKYTTESGCTGTSYYTVKVYDKPKADFNYTIPCGNSLNLQFSDRSNFSDYWKWDFGDNSFNQNSTNPSHYFKDTGKYNVTFINRIGSCADTVVKQVHANLLPSAVVISGAANTCEGTRGAITFKQTSLRISSGTWNFGDGTVIPYDTAKHEVKHTYTRTGTYQVTLTGISGNCTLVDRRTVYILLKQNPVLTANKTEICSNDNVTLKISNLETNPYNGNRWNQYYIQKFEYENGSSFTGQVYNSDWDYTSYSGTLQNLSAGVSKIRVLTTSHYTGCIDTSNFINIKVNGPVAGFKISANGICYKTPFVFEDTSKTVTNTALTKWHWDFGDGKTETKTSGGKVEHLYTNPGNYPVRLTVTDAAGCVATSTHLVNAKGPKAAFTTSGLYVPNVPLNTTVNFYNNTISWYSNSVNYSWEYGDGGTSTNFSGLHTYTQPGVNTVRLIANDPSIQCADTATQVITVKDFNTAFTFTTTYLTNNSCPPVLVRINNLSVGTIKVVWDFGDGTSSTDLFYPSHTYYNPGVYKITLYTYGYNGLTGTYVDSVTVGKPSAQIAADVLAGCVSQKITLTANATNTHTYSWDFGDGTVKNGTATFSAHDYLTPGVYEPKLIVKDAKGCISSTKLPEKIIIDSLSVAIKGIPPQICDSTKIFFAPDVKSIAADLAQKPLIYHWDFGTGNAADTSNIKNAVFNYNKPGTYTVRLKVISPYGCVKEAAEQITVHKKSKAEITGPLELCEGSTATFKGNASVTPVEWNWTFNNGNNASVQNPEPQLFTAPNTYDIQLIVKHQGCSDTTISKLVVHPKPVVTVSTPKDLLCLGESVQLKATGGTAYSWKPATGINNSLIATPVVSPKLNTTYTVEVINEFGCTRSDSLKLTVIQPVKLSAVKDTFVCVGSSVQLKADGAASYLWINNTNGLNNLQTGNPFANPSSSVVYTVVGSDAYNCFKDTAFINVAVKPLPTVVAEPDVEMLAAEEHQLKATASSDVVYWEWSPAEYLSCTKCPSPVTTPRMPIDYIVTVKTQFGCAATDTVNIKLQCSEDFVFIPTAFTPNNDGKNDLFYIKGKGIGIIKSLLIYNRWGELIFSRKNFNIDDQSSAWDGRYKGKPVPVGSYVFIAEMECDDGKPIIKKGTVTVVY